MEIGFRHIFSCEADPAKRQYLLDAFPETEHIYDDNLVFSTGEGYCHVCRTIHKITTDSMDIDVFFCGPSCKDLRHLVETC